MLCEPTPAPLPPQELQLGPLLKHPLVIDLFKPPPSVVAVPEVPTFLMAQALNAAIKQTWGHRPAGSEAAAAGNRVQTGDVLRELLKLRGTPGGDPMELCVRITGLGLYIKALSTVNREGRADVQRATNAAKARRGPKALRCVRCRLRCSTSVLTEIESRAEPPSRLRLSDELISRLLHSPQADLVREAEQKISAFRADAEARVAALRDAALRDFTAAAGSGLALHLPPSVAVAVAPSEAGGSGGASSSGGAGADAGAGPSEAGRALAVLDVVPVRLERDPVSGVLVLTAPAVAAPALLLSAAKPLSKKQQKKAAGRGAIAVAIRKLAEIEAESALLRHGGNLPDAAEPPASEATGETAGGAGAALQHGHETGHPFTVLVDPSLGSADASVRAAGVHAAARAAASSATSSMQLGMLLGALEAGATCHGEDEQEQQQRRRLAAGLLDRLIPRPSAQEIGGLAPHGRNAAAVSGALFEFFTRGARERQRAALPLPQPAVRAGRPSRFVV